MSYFNVDSNVLGMLASSIKAPEYQPLTPKMLEILQMKKDNEMKEQEMALKEKAYALDSKRLDHTIMADERDYSFNREKFDHAVTTDERDYEFRVDEFNKDQEYKEWYKTHQEAEATRMSNQFTEEIRLRNKEFNHRETVHNYNVRLQESSDLMSAVMAETPIEEGEGRSGWLYRVAEEGASRGLSASAIDSVLSQANNAATNENKNMPKPDQEAYLKGVYARGVIGSAQAQDHAGAIEFAEKFYGEAVTGVRFIQGEGILDLASTGAEVDLASGRTVFLSKQAIADMQGSQATDYSNITAAAAAADRQAKYWDLNTEHKERLMVWEAEREDQKELNSRLNEISLSIEDRSGLSHYAETEIKKWGTLPPNIKTMALQAAKVAAVSMQMEARSQGINRDISTFFPAAFREVDSKLKDNTSWAGFVGEHLLRIDDLNENSAIESPKVTPPPRVRTENIDDKRVTEGLDTQLTPTEEARINSMIPEWAADARRLYGSDYSKHVRSYIAIQMNREIANMRKTQGLGPSP